MSSRAREKAMAGATKVAKLIESPAPDVDAKIIRKWMFKTVGRLRELNLSHAQGTWYLKLDSQLVGTRGHNNSAMRKYSTSVEFPVALEEEELSVVGPLTATMTMEWIPRAIRWHYTLTIGGQVLDPCWSKTTGPIEGHIPIELGPGLHAGGAVASGIWHSGASTGSRSPDVLQTCLEGEPTQGSETHHSMHALGLHGIAITTSPVYLTGRSEYTSDGLCTDEGVLAMEEGRSSGSGSGTHRSNTSTPHGSTPHGSSQAGPNRFFPPASFDDEISSHVPSEGVADYGQPADATGFAGFVEDDLCSRSGSEVGSRSSRSSRRRVPKSSV
jgi:hypothetical protein